MVETKKEEKIILGLVGKRASGKNVAGDFIKKNFDCHEIVFSDFLKRVLNVLDIQSSRENLSWFVTKMRKRFGEELLAEIAVSEIKNLNDRVFVCNGLRQKKEIEILRKNFPKNFFLLSLESEDEKRFERIKGREAKKNEKKDKISQDLEEFLKEEATIESEKEIDEIQKMADFRIENNGDFKETEGKIERILKNKLKLQTK